MCDRVDTDLDKFFNRKKKASNDLEFFKDDIGDHLNIIEEQIMRIKSIAEGYNIELKEVINTEVIDILTNGKGL